YQGRTNATAETSELLMVFLQRLGVCWRVGLQGCADRRFSGMKTASLQGRIHGVSARPCSPARPYTVYQPASIWLLRSYQSRKSPSHLTAAGASHTADRAIRTPEPPRPCTSLR